MCSSGRRCPCPVGPSLPPCSLLIVQPRGNFRRVVSRGGITSLQCRLVFGDAYRSPPLLFFPVHFHFLSVRCCGFSTGLADPRFTHPALRWSRISLVDSVLSPLLSLRMGAMVLVSWVSVGLAVSVLFRFFSSCQPFCSGGNFETLFFIYFLFIYFLYNDFCFLPSFLYRIAAA